MMGFGTNQYIARSQAALSLGTSYLMMRPMRVIGVSAVFILMYVCLVFVRRNSTNTGVLMLSDR